ncbi:RND transporter, HAE1/HME family, permease domain protein, partial [Vibrio parahaemolyticus V-223/04]
SKSWFAILN